MLPNIILEGAITLPPIKVIVTRFKQEFKIKVQKNLNSHFSKWKKLVY